MNIVRTTHRHNRDEGIESCNILSWQVPTLTCPCGASARCVRRHGNPAGTVAAEMDTALVEDVHALWENE
ncbi:MAG TPA: hypothetical protein DIT01_21195 [Lentisphaeria bacterium]|nr:hypothetical protein [Lentisphaeria bacterium]